LGLPPDLLRDLGIGVLFVLGASLGLVFVPFAGPVLAAITVVGATHKIGLEATAVTLCYAIGAAIPLLVLVYLSRRATSRSRSLRRRAPLLRQAAGLLIIASAAVIAFGVAQPLQRELPGYTTALDSRIEGSGNFTFAGAVKG
jgi:Cytochrome C biogenesis protein transmembrane region